MFASICLLVYVFFMILARAAVVQSHCAMAVLLSVRIVYIVRSQFGTVQLLKEAFPVEFRTPFHQIHERYQQSDIS